MRAVSESTKILLEHLKSYLNLSGYEAKVYEFLVRIGPSTARNISTSCGVPRTKVYEVLRKLTEQKMVFEIPSNPKLFMASPPSELFKNFLNLYETIVGDFHAVALHLQKIYEESMGLAGVMREETWLFSGSEALKRILNLLSNAEKSVEIFSSWDAFLHFYSVSKELLSDLSRRKVKIRLYVPKTPEIDKRCCFIADICFRTMKNLPSILIFIIDDKHVAIRFMVNGNDLSPDGEWMLINSKKIPDVLKKTILS